MDPLLICLTTTSSEQNASEIARAAIENDVAACVQIEGPIQSFYTWEGEICKENEFRIVLKTLESTLEPLEKLVFQLHSYDVPQWIVIKSEKVEEKYLKWCKHACSVRRLI